MKRFAMAVGGVALLAVAAISIYVDATVPPHYCGVCGEPCDFRYAQEFPNANAETHECSGCHRLWRCVIQNGQRAWHGVTN